MGYSHYLAVLYYLYGRILSVQIISSLSEPHEFIYILFLPCVLCMPGKFIITCSVKNVITWNLEVRTVSSTVAFN